MSSSILRRSIVVLALSAFLGAPATSLAGPRSVARSPRPQAATPTLISWLRHTVVSLWEKEGCSADPYGRCLPKEQTSKDNLCSGSPHGCFTETASDHGWRMPDRP
jgi:hypothetical protein